MHTFRGLIIRNLLYHWRANLVVLLGVAVGSAVLTGALLVGDSLKGSLQARVERQLGGIEDVARFVQPVKASLTDGLPGNVAPVLLLPGSLQASVATGGPQAFLGRVTVLGIDSRFVPTEVPEGAIDWNGSGKQLVISERVARKLGVTVGSPVTLGVEQFSEIPRSSTLSRRSTGDVLATQELTIAAILPADSTGTDFNLTPNPEAALNVFLPIRTLSRLVLGDSEARANTLLAFSESREELNEALRLHLRLEDYGLKFVDNDRRGYLSIESNSLILPPSSVTAIEAAARELGCRAEPTVVYIADTLASGNREIAYPVIAGLNPNAAEPLGPFLPKGVTSLGDNEIVLLEWTGSPLNGLPEGSVIRVLYFDPEVEGEGRLREANLTLRGYLPLSGAARDRGLTPEVRGVTDARAELRDLDRPPVLPREKIRSRVPDQSPRAQFFNVNKATPMAYVNLATGEKLFGSRFGSATSVRIAPRSGETLDQLRERLRPVLLRNLHPEAMGLIFTPLRSRLLEASQGGTDFGELFLGFSFFLIVAALMLVGLLFRLTLDRRAREIGLLLATGYSVSAIRSLLLAEGLTLSILGATLGLGIGLGYNLLLIRVLAGLWPDPEVSNILHPHATVLSFLVGFFATLVMAVLALWLSLRGLVKVSPPALLRGETQMTSFSVRGTARLHWTVVGLSFVLGMILIIAGLFLPNPDFQAMSFFCGGGLWLTGSLAAFAIALQSGRGVVSGRGWPALALLGLRNASRNRTRSLLTAALLASAAFLLVVVECFRREPGKDYLDRNGGSGGFNLIATCDVPLFEPLESAPGQADLEKRLQETRPATAAGQTPTAQQQQELKSCTFFSLRLHEGDDASCLNLFQATQPRVLGVPDSLIERGGFKFYGTASLSGETEKNPWLLLKTPLADGVIPVFCEQNTAEWMLKLGIGDDWRMPGDDGQELRFRIVGTFTDSPFQSELVMSDESFLKAFPRTGGYRVFLLRTPAGQENSVASMLASAFRANGMIATPTIERVAVYQAVIGAYLSTFQVLGGLGLLLGVLGLAIVVLRGVWERVGELAVLRAMGYRTGQLQFLVLAENAFLLLAGLLIGLQAALVSVAPHFQANSGMPIGGLLWLLSLVIVVGLGVTAAATAGILRVPVIPALRSE